MFLTWLTTEVEPVFVEKYFRDKTQHPPQWRISTLAGKNPFMSNCIILDEQLPVSCSVL